MKNEYLKKINIPDKPGVYFFKKDKHILYVGKATSLRDRTRSYMSKGIFDMRGPLVEKMVEETNKIDWEETDSVLEALILEAILIKKYQPKYNTKEKSDKSFNYVCITKDKKIAIVRGKTLNKEKFNSFFGPFPNSNQLYEALKIIRKIFPFFDDKRGTKGRDEFYKQINLIPASLIENKNNIKNIKLLFEGKKKKILNNLRREMKMFSKLHRFEDAIRIRNQVFALNHINDVALIKNSLETRTYNLEPNSRIEAYDIAHMSGKNMVGVMVVVEDGEIAKDEYRKFKIKTQNDANDTGALKEVLERRLAHIEWPYPSLIVVDGGIAQINTAKIILAKNSLDIGVVSVLKDEHHKPKNILLSPSRPDLKGVQGLAFIKKNKKEILLANNEAHRFAITYHKKLRNKNFLKN